MANQHKEVIWYNMFTLTTSVISYTIMQTPDQHWCMQ